VQAGDGLIWNKSLGINGSYHFYNQATSTDGGQTWTAEATMDTLVRGWVFCDALNCACSQGVSIVLGNSLSTKTCQVEIVSPIDSRIDHFSMTSIIQLWLIFSTMWLAVLFDPCCTWTEACEANF
jgi:hypothetical protein